MVNRFFFGLCISILLIACQPSDNSSQAEANSESAKPANSEIPLGQLSENVTPLHYSIELKLIPEAEKFSGKVLIDLNINNATSQIYLHGKGLNVKQAFVTQGDKQFPASYRQVHDSGVALIELKDSISGKATLAIDYEAPYSESLDAIYKVKEAGETYLFSQLEAISARMAFPSFDEPRFKTPFDVSIISKVDDKVITNNPEVSQTTLEEGLVKHVFSTTKPLPTYLLTFAVGPLDVVEWQAMPATDVRKVAVPLRGIAAKGKGQKLKYALENTRPLVEALEHYFQIPYPYEKLDIIAAPDFAFGAMENAGAIVYRETLLLMEDNPPLWQKRNYGSVNAHELGHQWFGNLVTPKWWDDIWLNEAFATWVTFKAVQRWRPDFEYDRELVDRAHGAMAVDARSSARQIRNPIKTNDDIMNAFDGITYQKGGGVLQMFESYLGKENFQKGVQLHMQRYAYSGADVNDFLKSIADGSGNSDMIPAFESFLYQSGVPAAQLSKSCKNGKGQLQVSQARYVPLGVDSSKAQRWQIPFCFKTDQGQQCELLTQEQEQIALDYCPEWVMPNVDGAGYYRWNMDSTEWAKLNSQLGRLTAAEQISLANNLIASYNTGGQKSDVLLHSLVSLAESHYWDVSAIPDEQLKTLRHKLLDDKFTDDYKKAVATIYMPLFKKLGYWPDTALDKSSPIGTALLRTYVLDAVAWEARIPEVRQELVSMLKKYLGSDNSQLNPDAISPDLIDLALRVFVETAKDEEVLKLKDRALASTDAVFRGNVLGALTDTTDLPLGEKLVNELLTSDKVRSNEAQQLLNYFMANPELRSYTWLWLKNNLDDFLTNYSSFSIARIVGIGQSFCNKDEQKDLSSFFTENQQKISGAPRKIAETVEVINQCIALKQNKADEFKRALAQFNQSRNM